MWGTRKTNTIIAKSELEKAQMLKTTEYCREQNRNKAKRAQQVIEITVYN